MNYNITESALWTMTFAHMCAKRAGRTAATPLDLLYGVMLSGEDSLGGHLLRATCTRQDLFPTLGDPGLDRAPARPEFGGELTAGAREVMEGAIRLAEDFETPYVGSEHLLVSLLERSHDAELDEFVRAAGLEERQVLRAWLAPYVRVRFRGLSATGEPPAMA